MIVSASYRTDIPAFYGPWFLHRLDAGYCRVANPYGGPPYRVALDRGSVDGFVFWTRNLGPFWDGLAEVAGRTYPFTVQFTVTGYPKALETSVVDPEQSVGQIRRLARTYGPRAAVWRYDPILVSDLTPQDWHLKNFARLAQALRGSVDEVTLSFAQIYKKTKRNLDNAARTLGFAWEDPPDKEALVRDFVSIADENGMAVTLCTQPGLDIEGARPANCIDAKRLSDQAGFKINGKIKGNRPGCYCTESRDIGAYDSCPQGCIYCYANQSRVQAKIAYRDHDQEADALGLATKCFQNKDKF